MWSITKFSQRDPDENNSYSSPTELSQIPENLYMQKKIDELL